jgi:hypothetical protein
MTDLDRWVDAVERQLVEGIPVHQRRRRRNRLVVLSGVAAIVVVIGAILAAPLDGGRSDESIKTLDDPIGVDDPDPDEPVGPSVEIPPDTEPSQSPADAARDHIVPEVAALPLRQRLFRLGPSVVTAEGTWQAAQTMLPPSGDPQNPCVGDRAGRYGVDFVCPGYEEILLLDGAGKIVRAFPIEGTPAHVLVAADDAIYCAKGGDGGLPDRMLCRIDRRTGEMTVRVFLAEASVAEVEAAPTWYPAYGWLELEEPGAWQRGAASDYQTPPSGPFQLEVDGEFVYTDGPNGPRFDRTTLKPVDR